MIVLDLRCRAGGHRFEGWFASREAFGAQQEQGLLACPSCGSLDVGRALSAPRLARKGNQVGEIPSAAPRPSTESETPAETETPAAPVPRAVAGGTLPPEAAAMMQTLARMQAAVLARSRWVGERFADDARAMHYGERDPEAIHGQATPEEAEELVDEGIVIAALPFPVAPPDEIN